MAVVLLYSRLFLPLLDTRRLSLLLQSSPKKEKKKRRIFTYKTPWYFILLLHICSDPAL